MVSKSKSRSRAHHRNKQPSPDLELGNSVLSNSQPLPANAHDAQVLTIRQWSQLANISTRTAKRLFKSGTGPARVRLSPGRVGISVAAHKAWLEKCARGAA
jgi:predicted DNA-binding transcriptional regulator AlpA